MEVDDILKSSQADFMDFVGRIIEFSKADFKEQFLRGLNFDLGGKVDFFRDLVLDSVYRNIVPPNIANYNVRVTASEEYSCGINIWTRCIERKGKRKDGLESNVYILSFPIGIKDHREIKLSDPELFYSNIRQPTSTEYVRSIRIMRFFENINDYQSAIGNVQEGIKRVKQAYDSLKKELEASNEPEKRTPSIKVV